uniref:Uncharacterized protein n=1 Tax=Anguilla anguilla TaxID=7936 RepID=A0A0E9T4B1_ANGAN
MLRCSLRGANQGMSKITVVRSSIMHVGMSTS